MIPIPTNFNGQKFATKFNLGPFDFHVDDGLLHSPIPNLTEADLIDCITTAEEQAEIDSQTQAGQQLKAEYINTIQTLQQIESAINPTNAQVIAAVKFMARTIRLLLKLLARQYT